MKRRYERSQTERSSKSQHLQHGSYNLPREEIALWKGPVGTAGDLNVVHFSEVWKIHTHVGFKCRI